MERVYSWKQEHPDEYSRFSLDMMKIERNDFSCFERIFKMAVGFVPTYVLIECQKLLAPDSEGLMSADERAVAASRVVKQALKEAIRTALNEMEHEYETAYIKAALIRSRHLAPHASFSVFLRAISDFMEKEYKYDPAQRVDSFVYHNEKEFQTSKSSKWQRGRRIVEYLTEIFGQYKITLGGK